MMKHDDQMMWMELRNNIPTDVFVGITKALENTANGYALAYLMAMPRAYAEYGLKGVRLQILYALGNLGDWKGEEARTYKAVLRKFTRG